MPKRKVDTAQAICVIKNELWAHCIACGWAVHITNCLLKTEGPKQTRMRLNFRDDKVLVLEHRRELNEEEKKEPDNVRKLWIWEGLMSAPYTKVEAVDIGISFPVVKKKVKGVDGKNATAPAEEKE